MSGHIYEKFTRNLRKGDKVFYTVDEDICNTVCKKIFFAK